MAATNPATILKYRIGENFSADFDELVNIDVSNRKSDTGFTDKNKMMIRMRPGTTQVGDTIAGGSGTSKIFFHTGYDGTRRAFRGYNNKLWYLNGSTWTQIATGFSSSDSFEFNSVRIPLNVNGSTPTTYTTPANGGGAEKVAISASDPAYGVAGSNVGKVLIILTDPNASSAYQGVFGTIINNDGAYYTLLGAGVTNVTTGVSIGATYKVYDSKGEYLQVIDGGSNDRYFNGITEHTPFAGLATLSLRKVLAIKSTQYVTKQVSFLNSMWSFSGRTLFFSAGELGNPFFNNFEGARTCPANGDISDIFQFKNRLIVGGSNFLYTYSKDGSWNKVSETFGIRKGTLVDLGEDMYYLSTDGAINSLSENIAGTIVSTNIGEKMYNYTKDFLVKFASGFNGRKMYLYGQEDANTAGVICVYDVLYKFWSVYTGLRPSSIVSEDQVTYITDNNSDKVRRFDSTVFTDLGTDIEQKVAIKEIDLSDIFAIKIAHNTHIWLDNFDQDVYVDLYASNASSSTKANRKLISTKETASLGASPSMGSGVVGGNVLGGRSYNANISHPYVFKIPYKTDKALLWKVVLVGKDGSPFYLNEMDVEVSWSGDRRKYFSPGHTF